MPKAIIYKPAKSVAQSGTKVSKKWILEYVGKQLVADTLTGWFGSSDMTKEIRLSFDSKEDAVRHALANKIEFEALVSKEKKIKPNIYVNNFK